MDDNSEITRDEGVTGYRTYSDGYVENFGNTTTDRFYNATFPKGYADIPLFCVSYGFDLGTHTSNHFFYGFGNVGSGNGLVTTGNWQSDGAIASESWVRRRYYSAGKANLGNRNAVYIIKY